MTYTYAKDFYVALDPSGTIPASEGVITLHAEGREVWLVANQQTREI